MRGKFVYIGTNDPNGVFGALTMGCACAEFANTGPGCIGGIGMAAAAACCCIAAITALNDIIWAVGRPEVSTWDAMLVNMPAIGFTSTEQPPSNRFAWLAA